MDQAEQQPAAAHDQEDNETFGQLEAIRKGQAVAELVMGTRVKQISNTWFFGPIEDAKGLLCPCVFSKQGSRPEIAQDGCRRFFDLYYVVEGVPGQSPASLADRKLVWSALDNHGNPKASD